jgi:hypothetical protein
MPGVSYKCNYFLSTIIFRSLVIISVTLNFLYFIFSGQNQTQIILITKLVSHSLEHREYLKGSRFYVTAVIILEERERFCGVMTSLLNVGIHRTPEGSRVEHISGKSKMPDSNFL